MRLKDPTIYLSLLEEFRERFAVQLIRTKLSQKEVSIRLSCSIQYVSQLATGRSLPSLTTLVRLADAMGIEPVTLLPTGRRE